MDARTRPPYGWLTTTAVLLLAGACSKTDATPGGVVTSRPPSEDSSLTHSGVTGGPSSGPHGPEHNPCAKGAWGNTTPDDLFAPAGMPNVGLSETAALQVYTATLKSGARGLELYVGVCNRSDWHQCSAAMQVELSDNTEQVVATVSTSVHSGRLFRFSESPYPLSCVAPGEIGMAAVTEFPEGVALTDVASLGYRFSVFQIDVVTPVVGVRVDQVEAFEAPGGVAFRGKVINDSDAPVTDPGVSVFPINEAGRPLGYAAASAAVEILPAGDWSFETTAVTERGAGQVTFALANIAAAE